MPQIGEQWNRLQAMRASRDGKPAPAPVPTGEQQPDVDSAAAQKLVETPAARDPETGRFVKEPETPAKPETVVEPEAVPPPVAAVPPVVPPADASPRGEEVEIEGVGKVVVDASLAAAFKQAKQIQADAKQDEERERIKSELREELKAEMTPAESAADKALREAEAEATKLPPKPDHKLLISDPEEYERQRDVYEEARTALRVKQAKAEILGETQKRETVQREQGEQQARAILSQQFYDMFPILKDSKVIVDGLLDAKFTEVVKSGALAKPLTPEQREGLKKTAFADVAARATAEVVRIAHAGKKIAPPPPPPPTTVSSAPAAAPKQKAPEPEKPREKFPKGSVSSLLKAHQQRKAG